MKRGFFRAILVGLFWLWTAGAIFAATQSYTNTTGKPQIVYDYHWNPITVQPGQTVTWTVPDSTLQFPLITYTSDCTSVIARNRLCFSTGNDHLYVGNGVAAVEVGGVSLKSGNQCSFVFGAADTTKTCTLGAWAANALTEQLTIVIPNFSATNPTATFTLRNAAAATVYEITNLREGTTIISLQRPLEVNGSYTILLSEAAGAGGGTATVDTSMWR